MRDTQLKPVIGVTGYDLQEEEEVIREMLSWRPAGLIVAGLEHSDPARRMLGAADCPVVEVMDVDGTPVAHCVGISHLQAGQDMAGSFWTRGTGASDLSERRCRRISGPKNVCGGFWVNWRRAA